MSRRSPSSPSSGKGRSRHSRRSPSEKDLEKYYKSNWYAVLGDEVDKQNSYKERILFKNGTDTADLMEIDEDETLPYFSQSKRYIKLIHNISEAGELPVFELSVGGTLVPVEDDELDFGKFSVHKYYIFSKLPTSKTTHESVIRFMNRERAVARKKFVDEYKKICYDDDAGCTISGGKTKKRRNARKQIKARKTRHSRK